MIEKLGLTSILGLLLFALVVLAYVLSAAALGKIEQEYRCNHGVLESRITYWGDSVEPYKPVVALSPLCERD